MSHTQVIARKNKLPGKAAEKVCETMVDLPTVGQSRNPTLWIPMVATFEKHPNYPEKMTSQKPTI